MIEDILWGIATAAAKAADVVDDVAEEVAGVRPILTGVIGAAVVACAICGCRDDRKCQCNRTPRHIKTKGMSE